MGDVTRQGLQTFRTLVVTGRKQSDCCTQLHLLLLKARLGIHRKAVGTGISVPIHSSLCSTFAVQGTCEGLSFLQLVPGPATGRPL